jgi:predicted PurR-regulated permease PerM
MSNSSLPTIKLPLTVRRSVEIWGVIGLGYIIVVGRGVLMPLVMAAFLALLLLPVYRWFRSKGIGNAISILLSLLVLILIVGGISIFLSFQVAGLLNDIPEMQKNLNAHWQSISSWIADKWNIPIKQQLSVINKQVGSVGNNISGTLQGAALSLSNVLIFIGLLPIYIFLLMFYKGQLRKFIMLWFNKDDHQQVNVAFQETQVIVKHYLVGLLIQITYLTVLVGGVLMLFGIKHAILIGLTFGILNLIPYVGALLGNVIGVLVTLTSSQELWHVWLVLGTIAVVQFLDNNILMPRIVGSKVKLNSLASIVGIIIGGTLAGIPGMFLSIPVMAVMKIMFDKSPALCQWGVLLGEPEEDKKDKKNAVKELKQSLEDKRNTKIDKELDPKNDNSNNTTGNSPTQ